MSYPRTYWGPVARGLYIALLWLTVFVGWHYPAYLTDYVLFLVFLGFGLRPLLEVTGLDAALDRVAERVRGGRLRKFEARRRAEIRLRERDKRYRYRHTRDPRLPRNW